MAAKLSDDEMTQGSETVALFAELIHAKLINNPCEVRAAQDALRQYGVNVTFLYGTRKCGPFFLPTPAP